MGWRAVFLLAVAMTWSGAVQAEVYRCNRGGVMLYTDEPCSKTAKPAKLPELSFVGTPAQKKQVAHKAPVGASPKRLSEAERREEEAGRVLAGLAEGKVVKGMTPEQVRGILGEPTSTSLQEGRENITVWSYRAADRPLHTISFRAGAVNSIYSRRKKS